MLTPYKIVKGNNIDKRVKALVPLFLTGILTLAENVHLISEYV
jgi:hypothetical protein